MLHLTRFRTYSRRNREVTLGRSAPESQRIQDAEFRVKWNWTGKDKRLWEARVNGKDHTYVMQMDDDAIRELLQHVGKHAPDMLRDSVETA